MFVVNELISGNIYNYYMWVYNTVIGDFQEYSFQYDASMYRPKVPVCGGQTACLIINNEGQGNKLEYLLYSSQTNSFSLFDTPLYDWGNMSFTAGGLMIDGYDEHNYFLYDVQTNEMFTHSVDWTQGVLPGVQGRALGNYWSVFAYTEQNEDTVHVFSYNRTDGNLYSFDLVGRASASAYRSGDFYGLLITDLGVITSAYLYAPLFNNWIAKDFSSTSYRGVGANYFYLNYTNLNQTYLFDAKSNQEYWFTSSQQPSHVFARDSVFQMYSSEGKYIGYSINKNTTNEFVTSRLLGQQWSNFIVLNHNGSSGSLYDHLLYDGYNNIFAPLTLTQAQGIRKVSWPGGKTAFIGTENGYLFAYSPYNPNGLNEDPNSFIEVQYNLTQNYPNPFNPSTTISWQSPVGSWQTIKLFDLLGQEIETIVDGYYEAGNHSTLYIVNSTLPSGVYFYQLKAGDFIQSKKMVLLK